MASIRRRARRVVVIGGASYVAALVLFHSTVAAGVVVARLQGRSPEAPAPIDIENLRRVDDRVWASAQPDPSQYAALSAAGVDVIVDLRTGAADDQGEVDRAALTRHGIAYVQLPVRDGHVPDAGTVRRFLEVVEDHDGIALVHCGAGVGRSSTVAAGYLAHHGGDVSLWDTLALGSVTAEQVWFLTSGERNVVLRRVSEALDVPRRAWSRLTSVL